MMDPVLEKRIVKKVGRCRLTPGCIVSGSTWGQRIIALL